MTIDTKRLATDAAYWRKCGAPDDATHYEPGEQDPECWARIVGDRIMHWSPVEEWHVWNPKGMDGRFIPRPQSEWVDGLPPVGCECEAKAWPDSWFSCTVLAHDGNLAVCRMSEDYPNGKYQAFSEVELRPLRTKEQRQRDELSDLITDNIKVDYTDGNFYIDDDKAVNAIIAAGWRKEQ